MLRVLPPGALIAMSWWLAGPTPFGMALAALAILGPLLMRAERARRPIPDELLLTAAIWVVACTIAAGFVDQTARRPLTALVSGLAVAGIGVGTLVGAPLAHELMRRIDWQNTYLVLAALTVAGAVAFTATAGALTVDPNDPLATATAAAEQHAYDGTLTVTWRADGVLRTREVTVSSDAGSVSVTGDRALSAVGTRRALRNRGVWHLLWNRASTTQVPALGAKYSVTSRLATAGWMSPVITRVALLGA